MNNIWHHPEGIGSPDRGYASGCEFLPIFRFLRLFHPKQSRHSTKKLLTKIKIGIDSFSILSGTNPYSGKILLQLLFSERSPLEGGFCMTLGRLRQIHRVLMVGICLFVPLFLAYSLYVDLSRTVFLSPDMSLEDFGDKEMCASQNEIKACAYVISSNSLVLSTCVRSESNLISPPPTFIAPNKPILRC